MRDNGYYWVKYRGVWQVGRYGGVSWGLVWTDNEYDCTEFEDIKESRLLPPDDMSIFNIPVDVTASYETCPCAGCETYRAEKKQECMHERIASYGMTSGSYCKDCGEEF